MYFTSELQQRVLQLFAFAVRDGGYLALGKAETIKPLEANFEPVHPHLTLYRRRGERVLPPIARMTVSPIHSPISLPELRTGIGSTISHMRSPDADPGDVIVSPAASIYQSSALGPQAPALLASRSFHSTSESLGNYLLEAEVGVILVNHDYDIQMINSAARYLLGIYRVAVGNDLIHLTQNVSATALRMAIDAAFRLAQSPPSPQPEVELEYASEDSGYSDTIVTLETVQGERRHLQIACFPQRSAPSAQAAETPPSLESAAPL
jgi:two-component system CheB/CheR fusion protein